MPRLTLRLLGPVEVALGGEPVSGLAYEKVRALLAYLAVESDRPHHRDTLAALLWPDQPDAAARKNLRGALATLRRAIDDHNARPPFLQCARDTLQFNRASDHTLDVAAFVALLDGADQHAHPPGTLCAGCAAQLAQAAALYRGDFLRELAVRDSAAFDEWVLLTREELHRQALGLLARLADYHERRGDLDAARQFAQRQLALEPWDEAAHRCLMRILVRSGRRTAALQQYERCRRLLADEFSAAPSAETTALYEQIRAGSQVVAAVPETASTGSEPVATPDNSAGVRAASGRMPWPASLPTPLTPLIGREQNAALVRAILLRDDTRLLTLVGPPGVGKTRLGLQAATELHGAFADGIVFVALAAVSAPDLVIAALARALGVQEVAGQALIDTVMTCLRGRQMLLLLDNFEQVLDAGPALVELLAAHPGLKLLVTSRARLRLQAEQQFPVAPLALPDQAASADVHALAHAPAVALFAERARLAVPDFALTAANVGAVAQICARLDGLPLAIELAAARSALFTPPALLARLDDRLTLLSRGARDLPARQRSLRATIDWSYDLLSSGEQRLFRRLAVFVDGCTLASAEAVGDWRLEIGVETQYIASLRQSLISNLQSHILDRLASLVDQSLLNRADQPDGTPRFVMLETIREYALEQLRASAEAELVRRRHATYYLALAEAAELELSGPQQEAWLAQLEREYANLQAALQWASGQGDAEMAGQLGAALWRFWFVRDYLAEGWGWLARSLEQRHALPVPLCARLLYGASWLARSQRDFTQVAALLKESLGLYRELGDRRGSALVLAALGGLAVWRGDEAQAAALLEESLALGRDLEDDHCIAITLSYLGLLAQMHGDIGRATELCEQSLAICRELGDRRAGAQLLNALATLAHRQGQATRALALYRESMVLFQALGARGSVAFTLCGLGSVTQMQGDQPAAAALYTQSLVLFRDLGHKGGIAHVLSYQGELAVQQGDHRRALACFTESLALARELGDQERIAACLAGLAGVAPEISPGAYEPFQIDSGIGRAGGLRSCSQEL